MANKHNPIPFKIGAVVMVLIALVVLYFGFVKEQPCDIDAIYFWCRVHPFTSIDAIGLLLFILGVAYTFILWWFYSNAMIDKKILNNAGVIAFALGVILMWLK